MKKNINDNTVVRVRVPKKLYEAIQARLNQESMDMPEEGMDHESEIEEVGGVEYAWIPAAAAALGISGAILKAAVGIMKQKNLKGFSGFIQAAKEAGGMASSSIDKSMGGGM